MYSLWMRTAQVQSSCRCRLCLHTGRPLVRRSTSAAPRRKATVADIFTACYTTILGTAAVLDAQRKDARKKELDDKLEKARAALCSLDVQRSTGQQNGESSSLDAGLESHPRHPSRAQNGIANALLQELGILSEITRSPLPPPTWMQAQLEWAHIEAAIAAEEQDPDYTLREPRSELQLYRTTKTVVNLVNQLLEKSESSESTRCQDNRETNKQEDTIAWEDLQDVLNGPHYPSFFDPSMDPGETARTRSLLGESIRRIFNQATSSKDIVARICFNMLTSAMPPSIHTFNTLIAGFNRIERPDLAQTVIDSFINTTAWPATQQTIVCLLSHYRGTNQISGVRDIISRMRGVKDTGLHFRIVSKDVIYSPDWFEWAERYCASRKRAYVQRADRNDEIFDSIIKSWLHFGQVGNAAMMLIACMRNGCSITIETLQKLITACLVTADFSAARRLMTGFAKRPRRFAGFIRDILQRESIAASRQFMTGLSRLFDMCWIPLYDVFDPLSRIHGKAIQALKQFVHRVQLELEMQQAENPPPPSTQRVLEASVDFEALGRLFSIDRRYQNLKEKISTTTALLNAVIIKMKTGYDFNVSLLESNRPHSPYYQRRQDSIRHAIGTIQIHPGPMSEEDIRLQLIRNLPDSVVARELENSGNSENVAICSLVTFYGADSFTGPQPRGGGAYNASTKQLECQFSCVEDKIRAILFAHLGAQKQKRMRFLYPNWHTMSIPKLVEYHMRRRACKASTAADRNPTDVTASRDKENAAERIARRRCISTKTSKVGGEKTAVEAIDDKDFPAELFGAAR
ncbi:hypothetical protein GGR52DRAFT_525848 [Hypoxylon sp. FL1284]|nr:hypothetical protein GGR52DRAFT_525848 [Hypoxylon sp. FL1284]